MLNSIHVGGGILETESSIRQGYNRSLFAKKIIKRHLLLKKAVGS